MPAAPPVEAVLLVHAGQRCQQRHGQPQVGMIHQCGRGASRVVVAQVDGRRRVDLQARGDVLRLLRALRRADPGGSARLPTAAAAARALARHRCSGMSAESRCARAPQPPDGGRPPLPPTTRRKSACRTMTAPSSCCRECGAGVGPTDRVIIQSLRPLSRPSPRRRAAARMMTTTTTTTHDDAW